MNKTPDEIKKGLERCKHDAHCDNCLNAYHCQVNADALALIQQLEAKVPRWISVKERLPEDGAYVLVRVKHPENSGLEPWSCIMVDTWYRGGWDINADSTVHEVTHWMPLPEPPKEDKNERES